MQDIKEKKELTTTYEVNGNEITLTDNIVRKYLVKSNKADVVASDQEIMMFLRLCKYQKLNPFLNEVYLVKMSNEYAATIITSKDVFIKRAAKNPAFNGKKAGIVVSNGQDNHIRKEGALVNKDESLLGGWCEVYRKDYDHPIAIEVSFNEYAKKTKAGALTQNWANMPATMIRKVAVAQALREAFPDDFAGMFVDEEMNQNNQINSNNGNSEIARKDFDELLLIQKD